MDDDNIAHLKPVPKKPGVMQDAIIEQIERYLRLAKEGTITDIAIQACHSDGDTSTVFVVENNWSKLLGATQYNVHRICKYGE